MNKPSFANVEDWRDAANSISIGVVEVGGILHGVDVSINHDMDLASVIITHHGQFNPATNFGELSAHGSLLPVTHPIHIAAVEMIAKKWNLKKKVAVQ